MQRKTIALSALVIALLCQITPVQPRAWVLGADGLTPTLISGGTTPMAETAQADFNLDGKLEVVSRMDDTAVISSGRDIAWQSPDTWQVTQARITDLNHDGVPEAALLVWRPFRSWPVDQWLPEGGRIASFHDDEGNSCQIILIGWQNGKYQELWAGSALAEPVKTFSAADLNGDGRQELITIEGSYSDSRSAPARALKVWEWNGFGFSVVSKIDGRFDDLAVVRSNEGHILILVP